MSDLLEKYRMARENTMKAYKTFEELNESTFQAKRYAEYCERLECEALNLLKSHRDPKFSVLKSQRDTNTEVL